MTFEHPDLGTSSIRESESVQQERLRVSIAARHYPEQQYWAVSGGRCTCRVGRQPGYDGHTHTDVVRACASCPQQLWPCDAKRLSDENDELVRVLNEVTTMARLMHSMVHANEECDPIDHGDFTATLDGAKEVLG